MIQKRLSLNKLILVFGFLLGGLFQSSAQEVAPFTALLDSDNLKIRGDVVFVGNNVLNRAEQTNPAQANTPYNDGGNNNNLWMEYIDICRIILGDHLPQRAEYQREPIFCRNAKDRRLVQCQIQGSGRGLYGPDGR